MGYPLSTWVEPPQGRTAAGSNLAASGSSGGSSSSPLWNWVDRRRPFIRIYRPLSSKLLVPGGRLVCNHHGAGATTDGPLSSPPLTTLCCRARFGIPAHPTGSSGVSTMELNPGRRPSVTIGGRAADHESVQPCHLTSRRHQRSHCFPVRVLFIRSSAIGKFGI